MGTNFYATMGGTRTHVGKRSSLGRGRTIFQWAVEIGSLEGATLEGMSRREFTEMLMGCAEQRTTFENGESSIGQEFC